MVAKLKLTPRTPAPVDPAAPRLITAAQVRQRFGGVSRMWLHRRIRYDGFPRPVRIAHRRFFRLDQIEQWERQQESAA